MICNLLNFLYSTIVPLIIVEDDVIWEYIGDFIPLIIVASIILVILIGVIIFAVIKHKIESKKDLEANEKE